jgi:hypothetical protein
VRVEVDTNQSTHVLDVGEADGFGHVKQLVDDFLGGLTDYLTYADRLAVEDDGEEHAEADEQPEADDAA